MTNSAALRYAIASDRALPGARPPKLRKPLLVAQVQDACLQKGKLYNEAMSFQW